MAPTHWRDDFCIVIQLLYVYLDILDSKLSSFCEFPQFKCTDVFDFVKLLEQS